jgi:hypothetical protein
MNRPSISAYDVLPGPGDASSPRSAWTTPGDISIGRSQVHKIPVRYGLLYHRACRSMATRRLKDITSRPVMRIACLTTTRPTCRPSRRLPPVGVGVTHAASPCGNPPCDIKESPWHRSKGLESQCIEYCSVWKGGEERGSLSSLCKEEHPNNQTSRT